MWIIQLLLAWGLLYAVFRWLLFGGKDKESIPPGGTRDSLCLYDRTGYLSDAPDTLRPENEPDERDPTDWF